jgi:tight adherence protein C
MTTFILLDVFLATALAAFALGMWAFQRDPAVRRRVRELVLEHAGGGRGLRGSLTQGNEPTGLARLLVAVGSKVDRSAGEEGDLRRQLFRAGYRDPSAPYIYVGLRVLLAVALPLALLFTVVPVVQGTRAILMLVAAAAVGYILPAFVLGRIVHRRQTRIVDALPDTLDLMVVCVEAGLGLNQALMRVGEEMQSVEPVISEEFNQVNLEMRAGTPRTEALKNLVRRTGVEDLGSLVAMLIQTDKFGTSVAKSLRVFSDSMRTRRRQRAEEAAAKTTIKLVFPLALCILPSLLVVVLGPAALHIFEALIKNH